MELATSNSIKKPQKQRDCRNDFLNHFIMIFPLWLLFFSELIAHINKPISGSIKFVVVSSLVINILLSNRYNKLLTIVTVFYVLILLLNLSHSFNLLAGIEEFIRFLFAPIMLAYGYTYKGKISVFISMIIKMAFISNLFQIYIYISATLGINLEFILPLYKDGGYIVNSGFLGVSNAILNLVAFILACNYTRNRYRIFLIAFFFIFTFLTFSYKTIPFLALAVIIFQKNSLRNQLAILLIICLIAIPFFNYLEDMHDILLIKIAFYVTVGHSARFESYRVMNEFLSQFHILGEGLGSFGGPSSIAHNSPVYSKYDFNWYNTPTIMTTDTFYPHLFVELSWLGGLIFLTLLFIPLFQTRNTNAIKIMILILSAFLFGCIFSFGLANLFELMCTTMLFYGISNKKQAGQNDEVVFFVILPQLV